MVVIHNDSIKRLIILEKCCCGSHKYPLFKDLVNTTWRHCNLFRLFLFLICSDLPSAMFCLPVLVMFMLVMISFHFLKHAVLPWGPGRWWSNGAHFRPLKFFAVTVVQSKQWSAGVRVGNRSTELLALDPSRPVQRLCRRPDSLCGRCAPSDLSPR